MKARSLSLALMILAAPGLLSCAAPTRLYVNSEADQGFYRRVAIAPFANVSGATLAGPKVARAFVTELIIADVYEIVEPEIVQDALRAAGADMDASGRYPAEKLQQVAAKLGVQGILQGTVSEYQTQRSGAEELPVLAFDVELTDLATGNVAWRVGIVRRGRGRLPVLGGGVRTLAQLTQESCADAVARLKSRALR